MRVRRAIWRSAGPTLGRAAPALLRAYYDAVVSSLVGSLGRVPGVAAVYAHGSYAAGTLHPGRSDVDLVVVVDDATPAEEVELLGELRRRFVPRQAVLPVDLTVLGRTQFARDAGWTSARRRDLRTGRPLVPVSAWRLLGGAEIRAPQPWLPDPGLLYSTEAHVSEVLADPNRRAPLARLVKEVERSELDTPAADVLVDRRTPLADALAAALELLDDERERQAIPLEREPDAAGWFLPGPDASHARSAQALVDGLDVRSATLYRDALTLHPVLLLEVAPESSRRTLAWALERGASAAHTAGLRLEIVTTRLAEDSWRSGFRWVGLVGAATHVAGVPLSGRIRLPAAPVLADLLDFRAFSACEVATASLLGLRTMRRDELVLPQLELVRTLLEQRAVSPPATGRELTDTDWARRAVGLRRICARLVGEHDALRTEPVPID